MKNLLRRLHLAAAPPTEDPPDGAHAKAPKARYSFSDSLGPSSSSTTADSRPFPGLSGLLSVAKHTLHQAGSSKQKKDDFTAARHGRPDEQEEPSAADEGNLLTAGLPPLKKPAGTYDHPDKAASSASSSGIQHKSLAATSSDSTVLAVDALLKGTPGIQRTQTAETAVLQIASNQAVLLQDEELQVRVAMALSVRDDPEAATIETIKDATRGPDSLLLSSTSQLLSSRYWKYSALGYEDKIVDGFYDVYANNSNVSAEMMPSLTMLQESSLSDKAMWEAVLVNRAVDPDLVRLEQRAIALASNAGFDTASALKMGVVNGIAGMVADQMGGPVVNADLLLENWKSSSAALRLSLKSVVLPLGQLDTGLGRHRALLFKLSKTL